MKLDTVRTKRAGVFTKTMNQLMELVITLKTKPWRQEEITVKKQGTNYAYITKMAS